MHRGCQIRADKLQLSRPVATCLLSCSWPDKLLQDLTEYRWADKIPTELIAKLTVCSQKWPELTDCSWADTSQPNWHITAKLTDQLWAKRSQPHRLQPSGQLNVLLQSSWCCTADGASLQCFLFSRCLITSSLQIKLLVFTLGASKVTSLFSLIASQYFLVSSSVNLMLPASGMHVPFVWLNLLGALIACLNIWMPRHQNTTGWSSRMGHWDCLRLMLRSAAAGQKLHHVTCRMYPVGVA